MEKEKARSDPSSFVLSHLAILFLQVASLRFCIWPTEGSTYSTIKHAGCTSRQKPGKHWMAKPSGPSSNCFLDTFGCFTGFLCLGCNKAANSFILIHPSPRNSLKNKEVLPNPCKTQDH